MRINVNDNWLVVESSADTPLLWVLRDELNLKGTRYGCGVGQCGACTVLFNGGMVRSCSLPIGACAEQTITTIEGVAKDEHPVVQAWVEHQVPQCGYCQSGQVMSAVSMLSKNSRPTIAQIEAHMTNYCRCGTYDRIRTAILSAAEKLPAPDPVEVGAAKDETP